MANQGSVTGLPLPPSHEPSISTPISHPRPVSNIITSAKLLDSTNEEAVYNHQISKSRPYNLDCVKNPQELDFIRSHIRGWTHGATIPYTVFKCHKTTMSNSNTASNTKFEQHIFTPRAVFEEASNGSIQLDGNFDPPTPYDFDPDHGKNSTDNNLGNKNTFLGYFSVPSCAVSISSRHPVNQDDVILGHLCYQNHYDIDDITFTFAGVVTNEKIDFTLMGLPKDVDPNRISVQFNCEFPPHVNTDILSSPYLIQNDRLSIFNVVRGSITFIDAEFDIGESPCHFNSMSSTQISYRHVFFYGGFTVIFHNSYYDPIIDRWIIEKKITLNEDGFIFDIMTYQFKKITLKARNKLAIKLGFGRIGNAITSSVFEKADMNINHAPDRIPSPPIFSDSRSYNKPMSPPFTPAPQHEKVLKPTTSTSSNSDSSNSSVNGGGAAENHKSGGSDRSNSLNKGDSKSSKKSSNDETIAKLTSKATKLTTNESLQSSFLSTSSNSSNNSRVSKNITVNTSINETSRTSTNNSSSSSSNNHNSKMSNVFAKSTRIFHRNHQRQSSNNSSASENNKDSNSLLKHTYSKQVKEHRSNSNTNVPSLNTPSSLSNSRSGSPIRFELSLSPLNQNSNYELEFDGKPLDHSSNQKSFANSNGTSTINVPFSNPSPGISSPVPEIEDINDPNTSKVDRTTITPPGLYSASDALNKSGITTISVFVFGGFTCHTDPEDPNFKIFKASSDLIKIELVWQETAKIYTFLDDAYIYLLGNYETVNKGSSTTSPASSTSNLKEEGCWPTARGYFASTIVNHNPSFDGDTDEQDNHENQNPIPSMKYTNVEDENSRPGSPCSNNDTVSSDISFQASTIKSNGFHCSSLLNELSRLKSRINFFNGKALIIQGGINEDNEVFSDFFVFSFDTGKWTKLTTQAYDYFEKPIQPFEDEILTEEDFKHMKDDCKLIEAELRACHHTGVYYHNEESEFLIFAGGFYNDYLRLFDKKPYYSDKFDVSRLSRFQLSTTNPSFSRILVLNLKTLRWKFLKYLANIEHIMNTEDLEKINSIKILLNARFSCYGGVVSLNDKTITICHGLAKVVPIKREDFEEVDKVMPNNALTIGTHVQFIFPSI